jgi:hypothetical protein
MRAQILTASYWLHVELGKNVDFLVLKHISYRSLGVHFIKHDIQGVFLKCAEMSFYFLTQNFLNIFFEFYMKTVARD